MIPDLLRISDDLLRSFRAIQDLPQISGEAGVSPQRYIATYGLTAHTNDLSIDAIDLIQRNRFDSATPLTRLIFECAMHCQWLVMNPTAHSALLAANDRHQKAFANTLENSTSFNNLVVSEPPDLNDPSMPTVPTQSMERICRALNDDDSSLYVIYRSLSNGTHSGTPLIERWIEEIPEPPGVAFRGQPPEVPLRFNQLAGTVAICLLWTNAAFNCMTRSQPMKDVIESSSRELETKPLLGNGKLVM
jgi:hypothetical protein